MSLTQIAVMHNTTIKSINTSDSMVFEVFFESASASFYVLLRLDIAAN